ncbi:HepT-like ribonuclease domain-containing protein [Ectothiorhodospira shaposhnikovii]|nr:HepT-like ribonuclease domain-containing protein [Ectothiorhodospira shaposhnikovii]
MWAVHVYLGIDDGTLWNIRRDDLPDLLPKLKGA